VVSQSHYLMLQRNLVYTALTRARQRAVLIVSGGLEHKPSGGGTDTPKDPGVEIITPKGSDLAPIERQPNDASE